MGRGAASERTREKALRSTRKLLGPLPRARAGWGGGAEGAGCCGVRLRPWDGGEDVTKHEAVWPTVSAKRRRMVQGPGSRECRVTSLAGDGAARIPHAISTP